MENASKALIIAGGILLAMMILALLIYVSTSMSSVAEEQDKRILTKQIEEFNKGYLAYNKTRMYGTDVITVVNKAIDYNKGLDTDDEEYFINIKLNLTTNFETTTQKVTFNGDGTKDEDKPVRQGDISLNAGTYNIKVRDGSMQINQSLLNFFSQDPDPAPLEEKERNKIVITYKYSALTNFKRAIFKCTDVYYEDGRIKSMTFSQL